MEENVSEYLSNLDSTDDPTRLMALQAILKLTEKKVAWVYEAWDSLLKKLDNENSYQRSIGIMVLCNLAKSDGENRINAVLPQLMAHTKDDKFITSRQCLQNIWKAALTNQNAKIQVIDHLEKRFKECCDEKHYNLLRLDIIQSIRNISKEEKDDTLIAMARRLIQDEKEVKYRKTYEAALKGS